MRAKRAARHFLEVEDVIGDLAHLSAPITRLVQESEDAIDAGLERIGGLARGGETHDPKHGGDDDGDDKSIFHSALNLLGGASAMPDAGPPRRPVRYNHTQRTEASCPRPG